MTSRGAPLGKKGGEVIVDAEVRETSGPPGPPTWGFSLRSTRSFVSNPALELLLPGDGIAHIAKGFEVNEASDMVSTREAGGEAALVLIHASREIVGDARVYHSRPTGHEVHVVGAHDPPKSCIWGSRPASFLGGLALNPPSTLRLFLS